MKELLTIGSNFIGRWTEEKKLEPQVEIILLLSEPVYSVDPSGEVMRQREMSQARFVASPKTMRKLATALQELAEQVEELMPPAPKE